MTREPQPEPQVSAWPLASHTSFCRDREPPVGQPREEAGPLPDDCWWKQPAFMDSDIQGARCSVSVETSLMFQMSKSFAVMVRGEPLAILCSPGKVLGPWRGAWQKREDGCRKGSSMKVKWRRGGWLESRCLSKRSKGSRQKLSHIVPSELSEASLGPATKVGKHVWLVQHQEVAPLVT